MKRWTLNILTALSLLPCVAVLGLSFRSRWKTDFVSFTVLDTRFDMISGCGAVGLLWKRGIPPGLSLPNEWITQPNDAPSLADSLMFKFDSYQLFNEAPLYELVIPHWCLALFFGLLPAFRLYLFYRRRRRLHAPGFPLMEQ